MSRRGLMRTTAAATTAATVGVGASSRRAQAFAPLVPIAIGAATAAGAVALDYKTCSGIVWRADCGGDVEEVSTTASKQSVFSNVQTAITSNRSNIARIGDRTGVTHDETPPTDVGDQHEHPNDNDVAHSLIEHAIGSAALVWADGGTESDAIVEAQRELDIQATISMHNRISVWNDTIAALSPHFDEAYYGGDPIGSTHRYGVDRKYDDTMTAPEGSDEYPAPSVVTPSIEMYGSSGTDSEGVVSERDISHMLPVDVADLPADEQPDTGRFSVLEVPVPNSWSDAQSGIITPVWHWSDNTPTITSDYHNYSGSTGMPDDEVVYLPSDISATYDGTTVRLRTYRFVEQLAAIDDIRQAIRSRLEDDVSEIYQGLSVGSIELGDVLSGRMLYQQTEIADGQPRAVTEMMMISGMATPTGAVSVTLEDPNGDEATGVLAIELAAGVDQIEIVDSGTIPASDYEAGYLVPANSTGGAFEIADSNEDIVITAVHSDDSTITWTRRSRYTADGVDQDDLSQSIEDNRERYEELLALIEELGGAGGGAGAGAGSGGILAAAVAALGAGYVIFGGD